MSPSLFFASPRPAVVELPHLITAMDADLIGRVAHITEGTPGLWRLPAPYDENDVFDPWRDDQAPFSLWALPANQAELLAPGRYAAEALFGTKSILLDTAIDEEAVLAVANLRGQRRDNGGFYIDALHDSPTLPKLVDLTRWSLMPVAPDRSHGLFVVSPDNEKWIAELREWCERSGRTHARVAMQSDKPVLLQTHAPDDSRERAAAQQIDQFVARMDRYFRLGDENLLPRIQQRLEAARRMSSEIAQAKQDKREAS